ncbi:hypothetical protein [Pseudomonas fontis]|uniref:Uncharacterized protein n=1 Tax=Pseudomonas fontis TaxID=2942633 RepID=A0ABT5NQ27_9PSED|nr:hypothetical protein [Pseudomonas fontis]MDD0974752.1 hypothetical protein [Pseudomonas fontis]MDD0990247.1 hypothetical protein [Pseudomonas fontis]
MSHLSPDRFIAVLGAQGVGLAQRQGSQQHWLGSVGFIAERSQAWAVALDALQGLLAERAGQGGRLSLVVSAQYCRYCLVPWSAEIHRPQELQAYARACFEAHYGQSLEGWRVILANAPSGHARIAAALPEALLQRVAELSRQAALNLHSVQPYLMTAFNHFADVLVHDDFLFLLAEPQRSVLLLAQGGHWQQLRSLGSSDNDAALEALIHRECELQDGVMNLYLHAPGRLQTRPQLQGVALCELPVETAPVHDVLCTMARAVA